MTSTQNSDIVGNHPGSKQAFLSDENTDLTDMTTTGWAIEDLRYYFKVLYFDMLLENSEEVYNVLMGVKQDVNSLGKTCGLSNLPDGVVLALNEMLTQGVSPFGGSVGDIVHSYKQQFLATNSQLPLGQRQSETVLVFELALRKDAAPSQPWQDLYDQWKRTVLSTYEKLQKQPYPTTGSTVSYDDEREVKLDSPLTIEQALLDGMQADLVEFAIQRQSPVTRLLIRARLDNQPYVEIARWLAYMGDVVTPNTLAQRFNRLMPKLLKAQEEPKAEILRRITTTTRELRRHHDLSKIDEPYPDYPEVPQLFNGLIVDVLEFKAREHGMSGFGRLCRQPGADLGKAIADLLEVLESEDIRDVTKTLEGIARALKTDQPDCGLVPIGLGVL